MFGNLAMQNKLPIGGKSHIYNCMVAGSVYPSVDLNDIRVYTYIQFMYRLRELYNYRKQHCVLN